MDNLHLPDVISLPEAIAVIVLGVGTGFWLWRRGPIRLGIAWVAGTVFFGLMVASRVLLYPEEPMLAQLRAWTLVLFTLYCATIGATWRTLDHVAH